MREESPFVQATREEMEGQIRFQKRELNRLLWGEGFYPVTFNGKPVPWDKHNIHARIYWMGEQRLQVLTPPTPALSLPPLHPAAVVASVPLAALEWLRRRKNTLKGRE